MIIFKDDIK